MSILLWIASVACSANDLGAICFTDLNAPVVYAYDVAGNEALKIEHSPDRTSTKNTSYRPFSSWILKDNWTVDAAGEHDYLSEQLSYDSLVTQKQP